MNALKSGCLEDIMDDVTEACVRRLGIDAGYARDSLPQGIVLFMPVSAIGTLIFTTYAAVKYSVVVTPFWSIAALVLAVVLFAATPPVPGANLLAYIVLFNLLGIPGEAIINAMIFDVIFGIFASAANLTLLQAEIGFQAHRLGMLNTDRLRKA